jgi:5-methyltetrahydrofolate--homocysteine methyltransferase
LYHGEVSQYIDVISRDKIGPYSITGHKKQEKVDSLMSAILQGDQDKSCAYTRALIDKGVPAQDIIDSYIARALKHVGEQYETGKAFIPDLLRAANTAQHALAVIKQHLPKQKKKKTLVLATVKGDIHDIGKNIAAMIFESAGYQVIDLGKDVDSARIVQAAKKHRADVVGLSALLTTTMPEMGRVVARLKKNKVTAKVIVGGPNVSEKFAREIGAYGAASTVMQGLRLLKRIM